MVTAAAPDWQKVLGELRRPFTPAAIKFKPQSVTKDQTKGLVSYYIDARLAAERLNAAVGADGWTDSYYVIAPDPRMGIPVECRLTVLGITKADVGQNAPGDLDDKAWKSAYSDALKRAAVKFGVGAYLYGGPSKWVETKVGGNGKAYGFSDAGAKVARDTYTAWIASKPMKDLFGDALDHGDVEHENTPEPTPAANGASGTGPLDGPKATKAEQAKLDRLMANLAKVSERDWAAIADTYCTRVFDHGRDDVTKPELIVLVGELTSQLDALDKEKLRELQTA